MTHFRRSRFGGQGLRALGALVLLMTAVGRAAEGDLRLVDAARNKDQQTVRALLQQRADVNAKGHDGSTALLWAVHWNDLDTASALMGAGADPNIANDLKVTPLSLACTNANAPLIEQLLNAGAKPNVPIATGETPVMTCAGAGSASAIKLLIARGADVNAKEPSQNQTALMWAAAERHADVVKLLIDHGADLQARTAKGFTALHFAARAGDLDTTRALLAAGVNINIRSEVDSPPSAAAPSRGGRGGGAARGGGPSYEASVSSGSTPLLVATMRAHVPLALFLIEQGADPNVMDAGFTPLHWAAGTWESGEANPVFGFTDAMSGLPDRQAKLQLVKALLAKGADPNLQMTRRPPGFAGGHTDVIGATPFLLASAAADMEMMRLLLAAGADPKQATKSNMTAIAAATGVNRVQGESNVTEAQVLEVVKFLISLGVDPKAAVVTGENAIFGAAYRGWNSVVQLLAEHGTDVNAISKSGTTPWRAASGQGDRLGGVLFNHDTAALLVKLGADPTLGKPCMAQNRCR
jgi:ankyrin repeat protein